MYDLCLVDQVKVPTFLTTPSRIELCTTIGPYNPKNRETNTCNPFRFGLEVLLLHISKQEGQKTHFFLNFKIFYIKVVG